MTFKTTPSSAQTTYYSPSDTTQTAEPHEYVQGSPSRRSVPSELAPLSARPSRDRSQTTDHSYSYSPSERYDPNSAMSVFSAWGSMLSDDPGAGLESNWFHDQRSQSAWGGNASQHGNTTHTSADAPPSSTAAPDFLSDLASVFSAPPGTEHEGSWFHDQRAYSRWSRAAQDSDTSYVSAQTSFTSTTSSLSSLSEAASHVASHVPRSNAGSRSSTSISGSHLTSSVSSLHALSEAGSAPQSSAAERQNRLPSVSSGGYNASLTGSERGAIAMARDAGRFRVDSIAGSGYSARSMTGSERQAINNAFGTGRFGRAQGSTTATLTRDGGLGSEEARRAAKGKGVATSTASTASTASEWIAASKIVFSDGDGGPLPSDHYVYPLHTDSRASGLPPERPAPRPPRR